MFSFFYRFCRSKLLRWQFVFHLCFLVNALILLFGFTNNPICLHLLIIWSTPCVPLYTQEWFGILSASPVTSRLFSELSTTKHNNKEDSTPSCGQTLSIVLFRAKSFFEVIIDVLVNITVKTSFSKWNVLFSILKRLRCFVLPFLKHMFRFKSVSEIRNAKIVF